ncbi:hypothetical protein [Anatilimnocola floriformis]|uniref:hypothetical protein n=1 Tax=Anatilimnocola floriformis TaxID=2948575 RepID=UPI0020C5448D|nr:hypothetical protein [Anatilimnocola floriformis]
MRKHAAPIIATVLLLLPVLYVGSYLALVVPGYHIPGQFNNYRMGYDYAERIFWPLEQIDRKLRPESWNDPATNLLRLGSR